MSPHLQFGGATNVLAVMADNRFTLETELARIAATELPWNSPHWHPAHGGVYRNVYLHVTDPLHITLPLYSFAQDRRTLHLFDQHLRADGHRPVRGPGAERAPGNGEQSRRAWKSLTAKASRSCGLRRPKAVAAGAVETFRVSGALDRAAIVGTRLSLPVQGRLHWFAQGQAGDSCGRPLWHSHGPLGRETGFWINGHHLKLRGWGQKPTTNGPASEPLSRIGCIFTRWT